MFIFFITIDFAAILILFLLLEFISTFSPVEEFDFTLGGILITIK